MTQGVSQHLDEAETMWIVIDLQNTVREYGSLDYLQVYTCDDGRKIWVIDELSQEMKEKCTPEELKEYDRFTLLRPSEY